MAVKRSRSSSRKTSKKMCPSCGTKKRSAKKSSKKLRPPKIMNYKNTSRIFLVVSKHPPILDTREDRVNEGKNKGCTLVYFTRFIS